MSPERPLAPKSYCAAVGIFACALLTPYKPSLTTEKKPGSAFCVGMSPERPLAPKSYCATVGFFCLPSAPIFKKFLCQGKRSQLRKKVTSTEKSYCAAVGIFACALLTPYKPSLTTEKKPGSAFCVAKPPKKPLVAESYRGAVGISRVGLACHNRCPNLASIQVFFRNVEARILHRAGACASVFVLGLVVLSRGKAKRERSSTLLFDPSMSALPIIETQKSQSIGLFTRQ